MSKIIKSTTGEDSSSEVEKIKISSLAGERPVLKGDLVQALDSAEKVIREAQQQGQLIIEKAKQEESAIRERALKEGYEAGLEELNKTIADFRKKYRQLMEDAENDMLKLSLKIAERIVGKALELDQHLLIDIIHQAIQSLKYQKEIRLRINPADMEFLKENRMELYSKLGESKEIEIVDDLLVSRGGCIIDTEIGTIDARLETQLRVMEKMMTKK